ncbi:MAG: hypothetical protein IPO16_07410 [Saprospiraceae bacterium]|nr:hypothetical protein [Saprospiraceae bacterium]
MRSELSAILEPYNHDDNVCCFIGTHKIKAEDCQQLIKLGSLLVWNASNMVFRSGNSKGADFYFNQGIINSADWRLQIIVPHHNYFHYYNKPDNQCPPEKQIRHPANPSHNLDRFSYHVLRNIFNSLGPSIIPISGTSFERIQISILGYQKLKPASVVFFYCDPEGENNEIIYLSKGICRENGIRFFDSTEWMSWL